jgi:NAD(P)H-hydrate epimerase
MQRAGLASWRALRQRWPMAHRIAVVCGTGNNGGDGYVIARLARAEGCAVELFEIADLGWAGDAARAREDWRAAGGEGRPLAAAPDCIADVWVDAILGIGLSGPPRERAAQAIEYINAGRAAGAGVLAVDVPSGLDADSGRAFVPCVSAHLTVTFIGDKLGLHTGDAPDVVGEVRLDALEVPDAIRESVAASARLLRSTRLAHDLHPRRRTAHKGDNGHVLIVGGDHGTAGAALMAARGALRAGAGLVSVATRREHASALVAAQPEIMAAGVESARDLSRLLARATVVAIGPGLGQSEWGRAMWPAVLEMPRLVVDADALNLLAQQPRPHPHWVLTPHPGEASRLLGVSTAAVQQDRLTALRDLVERYGGVPVLKGSGTLVWSPRLPWVCAHGNPGMATGGMGDVLTGVIAGLLAQKLAVEDAAALGVLAHAVAADRAAGSAERGLLPSDVIEALRDVVNP